MASIFKSLFIAAVILADRVISQGGTVEPNGTGVTTGDGTVFNGVDWSNQTAIFDYLEADMPDPSTARLNKDCYQVRAIIHTTGLGTFYTASVSVIGHGGFHQRKTYSGTGEGVQAYHGKKKKKHWTLGANQHHFNIHAGYERDFTGPTSHYYYELMKCNPTGDCPVIGTFTSICGGTNLCNHLPHAVQVRCEG